MAGKLTALAVKAMITPGRYTDGDGLMLQVRGPDARAWILRYRRDGKRRELGLGSFPTISLAEARRLADRARADVRDHTDPIEARAAAKRARQESVSADRTFKAVALECIEARKSGWRSAKHAAQWIATLTAHVFPAIGHRPISAITGDDVLGILTPIWTKTPETASRVRSRIAAVMDYASARKMRSGDNPAQWRGNLSEILPRPQKVKATRNQPALPWAEVSDFLTALADHPGIAAWALRFAILTAARTGEVRGATWGEIDMAAAVWTVPGDRIKAGRLHRVPLSAAALAVLNTVKPATATPDTLVFPSPTKGVALSDMALNMLVRGMAWDGLEQGALPRWRDAEGRPIVPHGFRSTFRVWASETRPEPSAVVEAALAHAIRDKVEAAYQRSDLLERRRPLMEAWGNFCTQPSGLGLTSVGQAT